jgi:hypothetical protein
MTAAYDEFMETEYAHQWSVMAREFHRLARRMSDDEVASEIAGVWCAADWWTDKVSRRQWVRLFRRAGYMMVAEPAERPREAVRLWRGCIVPERRAWGIGGMSWTTDKDVARWFADVSSWNAQRKLPLLRNGTVLEALVQPAALLAHSAAGEAEFVINPFLTSKVKLIGREDREIPASEPGHLDAVMFPREAAPVGPGS